MRKFIVALLGILAIGAAAESIIIGEIKADPECGEREILVVLGQGERYLQQLTLPPGGTFQMDAVPGAYKLFIRNPTTCVAQEVFSLSQGETKRLSVRLSPRQRLPADVITAGTCACVRAPCPCQAPQNLPGYLPSPWLPWWGYYGGLYSNYYDPGIMWGYGLNPWFYPHGGNFAAAKPNLYLSGPEAHKLKINIELNKKSAANWLATSPAVQGNSWRVQLTKDGKFKTDGVEYSYIYYDLRAQDQGLQISRGFCAGRTEAIEKMATILTEAGFKKPEVEDFYDHWRVKMPAQDVCVFPQGPKELESLARLNFEPPVQKFTRILFAVAMKQGILKGRVGRFKEIPKEAWSYPSEKGPKLVPANQTIEAREWGVGFHFDMAAPKSLAAK